MEDLEIQVNETAGAIECDFDSMKAYLNEVLEQYRTATFTDDSIQTAKQVVADLRKQQKAFTDRIKEVKKTYMQPFEDFKAKADELVKLYDEPIGFIDGQVKDYNTRRIEAKKELITQIYESVFGDLAEQIPLEKIYNSRWENKTFLDYEIQEEMQNQAERIQNELNIIRMYPSDFKDKAEKLYMNSLDLAATMKRINEFEEAKKAADARKAEVEKAKQEAEIQRRVQEALQAEKEKAEAVEQAAAEATATALDAYIPEQSTEPAQAYLYSINLTPEDKEALEMYMNSVGIEYAEV